MSLSSWLCGCHFEYLIIFSSHMTWESGQLLLWPIHRLSRCLMLTLRNNKQIELWIKVVSWNYFETVLWSGKRKGPSEGPIVCWGEVSWPPLLANAGSGGGAWEITRKWAMGIRLRWVLQLFQVIRTKHRHAIHSYLKPSLKLFFLHVHVIVNYWWLHKKNCCFSLFVCVCVCMSVFSGMPLAQAISILQKHCRIIKNVQVLYSEQVRWPNVCRYCSFSHSHTQKY